MGFLLSIEAERALCLFHRGVFDSGGFLTPPCAARVRFFPFSGPAKRTLTNLNFTCLLFVLQIRLPFVLLMRVSLSLFFVLTGAVAAFNVESEGNEADNDPLPGLRCDPKSFEEDHEFWHRFLGGDSMPPVPVPTPSPTRSLETQETLVTCISVIDENDSKDLEADWSDVRTKFPDRPSCLLRPITPGASGGLSFPSTYFDDPRNIFAEVTRHAADATNTSDWYSICNLEAGKPMGLTNVVLFVDNSGSMVTANVQNAFDLFAQRVTENGFQIVTAVENQAEDYIDPCLMTSLLPPTFPPITMTSAPAPAPVSLTSAPVPAPIPAPVVSPVASPTAPVASPTSAQGCDGLFDAGFQCIDDSVLGQPSLAACVNIVDSSLSEGNCNDLGAGLCLVVLFGAPQSGSCFPCLSVIDPTLDARRRKQAARFRVKRCDEILFR